MSSSEQDFLYQRKYAVSSDGENSPQGDISAGGLSNKNTEWMQNSYTWVSCSAYVGTQPLLLLWSVLSELVFGCVPSWLVVACLSLAWVGWAGLGWAWLGLGWLVISGIINS